MPTILVGVDESVRSQDAIAFVRALARASDARVVVASAFAYDDRATRAANAEFRAYLKSQATDTALDMARALEGVSDDRISIRAIPRTSPAHALYDLAEEEHADIVVVGSSHTGRLGRVFPGSTAERLLHGAPCAVAVVPLGYREVDHKVRRVGAAHDGTPEAGAALRAAADIAQSLGAELRVVHVHPEAYAVPAPVPVTGASYLELREKLERQGREALGRTVAALPEDMGAEGVFLHGDPAAGLAKASEDLDVLVTGSRRYGPLRSTLSGGVTGPLLRDAHCPVIVVPRGVEAPLGKLFAAHEQAVG